MHFKVWLTVLCYSRAVYRRLILHITQLKESVLNPLRMKFAVVNMDMGLFSKEGVKESYTPVHQLSHKTMRVLFLKGF